jgi:hypothetical protein
MGGQSGSAGGPGLPDASPPDVAAPAVPDAADARTSVGDLLVPDLAPPRDLVLPDLVPADVAADLAATGDAPVDTAPAGDGPLAGDAAAPTTPAFHLTLPLSSTTVTTRMPTVGWTDPGNVFYFIIELCRDAACTSVADRSFTSLTSYSPDMPLDEGVIYWRVRTMLAGGPGPTTGTAELFVGPQTAHDTSMLPVPDFNRDGVADLALAREGGDVLVRTLGGGAGGPSELRNQTLPGPTRALAYGVDLNADGYGDLLQARADGVEIYYGGDSGLVRVTTLTGGPGFGATLAGVGDVNGDGFGDVVIGSLPPGGTATAALHLSGRAGLGGPSGAPLAASRFGPAGDANADGYADVVACAPAAAKVHFYAGSAGGLVSSGMLADPRAGASGTFGNACQGVGDLNGDGFGDVVVTGATTELQAHVYLGGEKGFTAATTTVSLGPVTGHSADELQVAPAGDLNHDGLADVAIAGAGFVKVFLGATAGLSGTAAATLTGDYRVAAGLSDLNGDKNGDLVVVPRTCELPVRIYGGSAGGLASSALLSLASGAVAVCPAPLLAH